MSVGTMSGGQQAVDSPQQAKRPGIRQETLLEHGICHVSASDAYRQIGANCSGLLIPYRTLDGSPVTDGDKPYSRLRLDQPEIPPEGGNFVTCLHTDRTSRAS